MAKKVNPPIDPAGPSKNEQMSKYGKKAYTALVKKYGKNHMSEIAKSGHAKRKEAKLKAERAAKRAAKV